MSKRTVITGALVIVAIATSVFFLREPDPQAVLRQAAKNALEEKAFRVDLKATVIGLPKELGDGVVAGATGVDIRMRTDFDRADSSRQASVSTFEIVQGLSTGGRARIAGEARRKNTEHFLLLQALEGIEGVDASRVVGKWMRSARPFVDLVLASGTSGSALDASEIDVLKRRIRSVDLFTVVEKLPKESIDGAPSFHYAVEANMEVVSALLLKHREMSLGREMTSEDVLSVTNDLLQWNHPVGEVWVDARSRKIKQITLGTSLGQAGKGGASAVTLVFSNEGKDVRVEVPDAEDVDKVLGPLFEKRLSLSGMRGEAARTEQAGGKTGSWALPGESAQLADVDGDKLSDAQEAFYGADAWNPDTDGDGYADGVEVEAGMDPLGPGPLFGFGL